MKTSNTSRRLRAVRQPETTTKSFVASKDVWKKVSQAFGKLDEVSSGLRRLNARTLSASSPGSPETAGMRSTSFDMPLKPLPANSAVAPRLVVISKSPDRA